MHNDEIRELPSSSNIFRMTKPREKSGVEYVAMLGRSGVRIRFWWGKL